MFVCTEITKSISKERNKHRKKWVDEGNSKAFKEMTAIIGR